MSVVTGQLYDVCLQFFITSFLREAAKKVTFLMAVPLALPPPLSSLMAVGTFFFFFISSKQNLFFLNGRLFNPPPVIMARPLKRNFFSASLRKDVMKNCKQTSYNCPVTASFTSNSESCSFPSCFRFSTKQYLTKPGCREIIKFIKIQ